MSTTNVVCIPPLPHQVLNAFSNSTRECIERLMKTTPERYDLSMNPPSRLAAVLILLYEDTGELRVLLTTRSKALRSHPGQTALPGGRMDETDKSFVETAYREAHEEVALPLNSPDIHTIATLDPYISLYRMIVVPVVAVLARPSLLAELKAQENEVSHIFTHPLRAVLDPGLARGEPLAERGSEHWPYETDLYHTSDATVPNLGNTIYRMHRFRSSASPVKGLTADILIRTAEIAFAQTTVYERYAPLQLRTFAEMSRLLVDLSK